MCPASKCHFSVTQNKKSLTFPRPEEFCRQFPVVWQACNYQHLTAFVYVLVGCWQPVSLTPVHTTPQKLQTGVFTLKANQMLSVHTTSEEFENAPITGHFSSFCLKKTRAGKSRDYRDAFVFEKLRLRDRLV